MTSKPTRRLACATLVAALAASGCARPPSTALDDDITTTLKATNSPRTVGSRTYTAQPVEANLGPHRFMFPANLYYNQVGPFAGGGVMLAVFWRDFDAATPGIIRCGQWGMRTGGSRLSCGMWEARGRRITWRSVLASA